MDFMTSAVLGGIVYDILKNNLTITSQLLQSRLTSWVINDETVVNLATQLNRLDIDAEKSERSIQREIENSEDLSELVETIRRVQSTITQQHSGSGDNIAGDKIINN